MYPRHDEYVHSVGQTLGRGLDGSCGADLGGEMRFHMQNRRNQQAEQTQTHMQMQMPTSAT